MDSYRSSLEMGRRKQTFYSKPDEAKFKIILVGDSGVGKTSLFMAFTDEDSQKDQTKSSVTTVDFRLQPIEVEGEMIKLHIWDTAGQQKYRSIVESFFKGCQGAIIVFDLSRRESFIHATNQWFKLCENRVNFSQIILIGNKSDLNHTVTDQEVRQWSIKNGVSYFFSSIVKSENIEQPFIALSKKMLHKRKDQMKNHFIAQVSSTPIKSVEPQKVTLKEKVKSQRKKTCC